MLSELPRERASFVNNAAVLAAGDSIAGQPEGEVSGFFLLLIARHFLETSHATWLEITSQKPSLARIRHSSSSVLAVKLNSGSAITYGFR